MAAMVGAALVLVASPGAHAQEVHVPRSSEHRGGFIQNFDNVTIKRIRPIDLPQTKAPGSHIAIRTKSDQLPKPASRAQLRKIAARLHSRVVEVVVVQTPPRPYRQVPMVYFGHAVWITPPTHTDTKSKFARKEDAPKKAPVLVTTLNWLRKADHVYVVPPSAAATTGHHIGASRAKTSWQTRRRSLASVTAGSGNQKWLEEHRDELIPVAARHADKYRNLVTLVDAKSDSSNAKAHKLKVPPTGVPLFDAKHKALFRIYGYSPYAGDSLTATSIQPTHPDNAALAYYWQTGYPGVLGAPLVSQDGYLVCLNAFRHPKNAKVFLAIPTPAIASYLDHTHKSGGDEAHGDDH